MTEKWDAGETGCGSLAIELRRRLERMKPGERLELTTLDEGAPVDLPAWCRMTGHRLISADPPWYVIERRSERG